MQTYVEPYHTVSNTNIQKLQAIQKTTLRIATGCTRNTNTQDLQCKIDVLLMGIHLTIIIDANAHLPLWYSPGNSFILRNSMNRLEHKYTVHQLHQCFSTGGPQRYFKLVMIF